MLFFVWPINDLFILFHAASAESIFIYFRAFGITSKIFWTCCHIKRVFWWIWLWFACLWWFHQVGAVGGTVFFFNRLSNWGPCGIKYHLFICGCDLHCICYTPHPALDNVNKTIYFHVLTTSLSNSISVPQDGMLLERPSAIKMFLRSLLAFLFFVFAFLHLCKVLFFLFFFCKSCKEDHYFSDKFGQRSHRSEEGPINLPTFVY